MFYIFPLLFISWVKLATTFSAAGFDSLQNVNGRFVVLPDGNGFYMLTFGENEPR